VTQLTSSSGTATLPPPSLEYIHHSIDSNEVKYKNRNFRMSIWPAPLWPSAASNPQHPIGTAMKGVEEKVSTKMAKHFESDSLPTAKEAVAERGGWLKLGAVAAVSAIAGGLAAAWWYRNTLKKLHQAEEAAPNLNSEISGDDFAE
jgi:hypothetical protein